jgi:hypothetical protein
VGTYLDIMPPIIQHFIEQVYEVPRLGEGANDWLYWEPPDGVKLEDAGGRDGLFQVRINDEEGIGDPISWGGDTNDYNIPMFIVVCYHSSTEYTLHGVNDAERFKIQIMNSDTSGLTGMNFARFEGEQWIPGVDEDSKYRYMRIPVMVRVSVTN